MPDALCILCALQRRCNSIEIRIQSGFNLDSIRIQSGFNLDSIWIQSGFRFKAGARTFLVTSRHETFLVTGHKNADFYGFAKVSPES
jgi:hypothetical protein